MDLLVRFRSRNSLATLPRMMANFSIIALVSRCRCSPEFAAGTGANFGIIRDTRSINLLVRFRSRNSLATLPRMMANFSIIALASILHFRDQRHLAEASGADAAHDLHDRAVGDAFVAAHEDLLIEAVLGDGLQLGRDLVERHGR